MTGKASSREQLVKSCQWKICIGGRLSLPKTPKQKKKLRRQAALPSSPYALDVLARKNYKGHPLWLRVPLGDGIYLDISCVFFSANTISAGGT